MSPTEWIDDRSSSGRVLIKSAILALILEGIIVTAIGWHEHWLAHPKPNTGLEENKYIEAEVFQVPSEARLVDEKKSQPQITRPEQTLSKRPGSGSKTTSSNPSLEETNQTVQGPKIALNHGPVAVFSPPPVIPAYLQDKEIKTHVVIDFFVNNQGAATPRLAGSSGHEELDALAIAAVKKWIFRPAEKDGKPIDAKVRLRIVFVVQ